MLIAALIIGLLTAYYFGLRAGYLAAGVSGALFLLALVMPSVALYVYGTVTVGLLGVLTVGPRMPGREKKKKDLLGLTSRLVRQGRGLVKRWKK